MINGFILGKFCSVDYGMIMTAPPPVVFAEEDVEVVSVEARSGDLIIRRNRYKNVPITYACAILPGYGQDLREAAVPLYHMLHPHTTYQRLTNSYYPESFRMGRVVSNISIDSIVEQAGTFSLEFDCKPQRFLITGEIPQIFTRPNVLRNSGMPSLPLITVYGSGDGTLTCGGVTVQLFSMVDTVTLDCELQDAYRDRGGILENWNGKISAPEFPVLQPGENEISWSGGVERVEIIPRWWTL